MDPVQVVHIDTWQAVLLGLLQGFTEFLPVSSTAHMAIAPQLLGMPDPGAAFSAIVQLGPIAAIISYFRKDIVKYVRGILRTGSPTRVTPEDLDARLGWYTLFATIPGAVFGVLLEKKIDTDFRRLPVIGVALIVLAIVLFLAERIGKRNRTLGEMTFAQSQVIGWAQVLSLVPGTSRSGVTITAGLFQGLDRESAARFSFLLSIPFITAAGIYKLVKVIRASQLSAEIGSYLLAAVVAGVFAYVVVKWFLGYMKEHNTAVFIVYRIVLGVAILVLFSTGVLKDRTKEVPAETAPTKTSLTLALPRS